LSASRTSKRDSTTIVASLDPMTPPTVSLSQKGDRRSHTMLASPGLSYFGTHASTSVISWTDIMLGEHVRCLTAIPCLHSNNVSTCDAEHGGTGAAPHSSGCICAGPDRSLTWDINE
jgi:hypothetical protein